MGLESYTRTEGGSASVVARGRGLRGVAPPPAALVTGEPRSVTAPWVRVRVRARARVRVRVRASPNPNPNHTARRAAP